jgi:hypothetical protein
MLMYCDASRADVTDFKIQHRYSLRAACQNAYNAIGNGDHKYSTSMQADINTTAYMFEHT